MHVQDILTKIAQHLGKQIIYIQLGVRQPLSAASIPCSEALLVSPHQSLGSTLKSSIAQYFGKKVVTYPYDSEGFFEREVRAKGVLANKAIDLAFINSSVSSQQVYRDVMNCLTVLSQKGFIVFDCCNPRVSSDISPDECGDVWRTVVRLRSEREDLDVFVLDVDRGVCVIRRGQPISGKLQQSVSQDQLLAMTFEDLQKDKEHFLNVKDSSYIYSYLKDTL